eukprot:6727157-Prymnesium_polylepis.1
MLTPQPSTYGLISCNNPSGSTGSHPGLAPSCAPIMQPRRRRPHHPLACGPPRPAGVARRFCCGICKRRMPVPRVHVIRQPFTS